MAAGFVAEATRAEDPHAQPRAPEEVLPLAVVEMDDPSPTDDRGPEGSRSVVATSDAPASLLKVQTAHLVRGDEMRRAFDEAGADGDEAERLLQELVAREVPLALELHDIEGALAAMLARSLENPALTSHLAKAIGETLALSEALRRRMQNSLAAAQELRAQRRFLAANRGRFGV